ncbi:MFS transporter [Acetobacter ghanensis]|uniref:MFS transporter n=1 Tax=Acetobacter ghanensis TaxID=431306 RepID=A0A0U5F7N9_9PROT|nr:MFS transporter [Acetobacter ghanensis]NHO39502.1 MFS transporter [Acetobacter ghanensis]GBQ46275.1 transporter [Acetobacter ghanensis DSM 18895]CEF54661.1 major facilitator transporter [Acetobacter ghanensis]
MTSPPVSDTQRRLVMLCAVLGIVLGGLDGAIANIALPTIARDLHCSETQTVWVVNVYHLAVAVSLLPAAALADSLGLKRVYGFGMALFTAASLACALSGSLGVLIGARVVQGLGTACMAALSGALVRSVYARTQLHQAFAIVALAVAISAAIGPTLAAAVLAVAPWPWLFLINVPIGIIAVALFLRAAPTSPRAPFSFDWAGTLLNVGALGLSILGVDALGQKETGLATFEIGAGLLCTLLLYGQQKNLKMPMLPLDLLAIPLFSLSILTSICAYAAQILAYVALPFLFQTVMHLSAVTTGLLVTPWPVLVAVAAPFAGRLATRHPASILSSVGLAILAGGLAALSLMPAQPTFGDICWRMALCGIGFGFYQTPNNLTVMTSGPATRSGAASGMMAVARTLGWALGSALVALVFGLSQGSGGAVHCLELATGFALLGTALSVSRRAVRREEGRLGR